MKLLLTIIAIATLQLNANAYIFTCNGHIRTDYGDTHYIHYNLSLDGRTRVSAEWHHWTVGHFGPFPLSPYPQIHNDVIVYTWITGKGYVPYQTLNNPFVNGSIFFGGPNGPVGPAGQGVFQLSPATGNNAGVTPSPMPTKNQ